MQAFLIYSLLRFDWGEPLTLAQLGITGCTTLWIIGYYLQGTIGSCDLASYNSGACGGIGHWTQVQLCKIKNLVTTIQFFYAKASLTEWNINADSLGWHPWDGMRYEHGMQQEYDRVQVLARVGQTWKFFWKRILNFFVPVLSSFRE